MKKIFAIAALAALILALAVPALGEEVNYQEEYARASIHGWSEEEGFTGIFAMPEPEPKEEDTSAGVVEYYEAWGPDTPSYTSEVFIIPVSY